MSSWPRLALVLLAACGDDLPARDAGAPPGDGAVAGDATPGPDGAVPLSFVEISITGCEDDPLAAGNDPDAGAPPACRGRAPLALDFLAVAPGRIDLHAWTFGDGSPVDLRPAPRHVFTLPGIYDVGVDVQGPGGTAGALRPAAVEVLAAGAGAACDGDGGCAGGRCVCGGGDCGPSLGVCADGCGAGCGADEACVDLVVGAPAEPLPWQDDLCLPSCADLPCPAGLTCRDLPADGGGYARACFLAGVGGDLGDACTDADGIADDDACATGRCLDEGVRGMCTSACTAGGCPDGAACATFTGGGSFCLPRCGEGFGCDGDPWLACELAGGPGARGFVVDEPPSVLGYCAPNACDDPADCLAGTCTAGFCGP